MIKTRGITTQAHSTATYTHSTHSEAGQTLTWARRFQSRHPAPSQRLTSSFPASHRFILKKFVAPIELLSVSGSCHQGASGRCQGLFHLRWDTPRNLSALHAKHSVGLSWQAFLCGLEMVGDILCLCGYVNLNVWVCEYLLYSICLCLTLLY